MKKSTVFIILFALVLCIGGVLWHKYGKIDSEPPAEVTVSEQDEAIYNSLSVTGGEKEYHLSEITAENAIKAIERIKSADTFYAVFTVEHFSDRQTVSTKSTVWKNGDKYRVESEGNINKTYICDGENVKIINDTRESFRVFPAQEGFGYAEQIGVADVKYILENADSEFISARFARSSGIQNGGNIIYVEFYDEQFDRREEFYISADYGIILSAQTYIGDSLSYRLTTSEFIDGYTPDGTMFVI